MGPGIVHSQAVAGLRDVIESRDSGFILGLHTEVPVVGHKLQNNSNLMVILELAKYEMKPWSTQKATVLTGSSAESRDSPRGIWHCPPELTKI